MADASALAPWHTVIARSSASLMAHITHHVYGPCQHVVYAETGRARKTDAMARPQSEIHASALRLMEAARAATAYESPLRRVADFEQLRKAMGVSPAVLTNWKSRGVSAEGALAAEALWGCSACWVLTGNEPKPWGPVTLSPDVVASLSRVRRMRPDAHQIIEAGLRAQLENVLGRPDVEPAEH